MGHDVKIKTSNSTRMGFEPTRAEHNGLAVHRLNHSATSSVETSFKPVLNVSDCMIIEIKTNINNYLVYNVRLAIIITKLTELVIVF